MVYGLYPEKSGVYVKKAMMFLLMMVIIIVVIPLLIVRSCSSEKSIVPGGNSASGMNIKMYLHTDEKVVEMPMEEYIMGVVAAEMPASFESEALKAQAVAARTYAYGRLEKIYTPKNDTHHGANICTDPGHCQAWISKENAMKKWGIFNASKNWSKISKAVNETKELIIVYEDRVVNPVFHSNSGGRTENSEDVWEGGAVPYLRSVESSGEGLTPEFETTVNMKIKEFTAKLKTEYPQVKLNEKDVLKDIKILDKTEGGRVKSIKVGNVTIKGTDFRSLFSLKSANFKIEKHEKDSIIITTYGNGHGVGMSQWGANYMAKSGGNYEEILKYYYKDVEISKISN
ncbi:MAG: stage II sporulation protein D [Clostridia bacterium]|nr:stage II sporulation protein D [Clostridia bacterium]